MYVDFIKNRRKEKGLLQKDIAKMLNVSTRTYKRMEDGNLTLNQVVTMGRILSFSVQLIPDECKIYTI